MAPALINHPVLPGNPTADEHIDALLKELSQKITVLETVTVGTIPVESTTVRDLRGTYRALNIAVRYKLRSAA